MHATNAKRHRFATSLLSRNCRGKGRRLLRSLEARLPRGAPRDRIPVSIGDGDRRVVERCADVGDSFGLDDALCLLSGSHGLLRHLFLAGDCSAWSLLRAGVCMCALATNGKSTTMAITAVRSDVHQSFDVHRDFRAERAFDANVFFDRLSQAVGVGIVEITHALLGIHSGVVEDLTRGSAADSVDVCQPDLELLLAWQIHAGDTCHLSLSLFMLGVSFANDSNHALALDHLAMLTDWFDAAAYFHKNSYGTCKSPRLSRGGFSELAFEIKGFRKRNQPEAWSASITSAVSTTVTNSPLIVASEIVWARSGSALMADPPGKLRSRVPSFAAVASATTYVANPRLPAIRAVDETQ